MICTAVTLRFVLSALRENYFRKEFVESAELSRREHSLLKSQAVLLNIVLAMCFESLLFSYFFFLLLRKQPFLLYMYVELCSPLVWAHYICLSRPSFPTKCSPKFMANKSSGSDYWWLSGVE